jgi:hypothetical protein
MSLDQKLVLVLGVLLSISECLDAVPSIKANSIWKAVRNGLYSLAGKQLPPQ